MVLQASGAISLNDLQTEFGGSNPTSLSEYYAGATPLLTPSGARGINGAIPTTGAIKFSQFYGYKDTQVVTVGYRDILGSYPTYINEYIYGFESGIIGSMSDGTSNIYSGASITTLSHVESTTGQQSLFLGISGSRANSGWTTMYIGSSSYSRTSAMYTDFGSVTEWAWIAFGGNPNPFGTTVNATVIVSWV